MRVAVSRAGRCVRGGLLVTRLAPSRKTTSTAVCPTRRALDWGRMSAARAATSL